MMRISWDKSKLCIKNKNEIKYCDYTKINYSCTLKLPLQNGHNVLTSNVLP